MRLVVVMNSAAGGATAEQRAVERALQTKVLTATGTELPVLLRHVAEDDGCEVIVVCGGDGTVSLVAAECVRTGKVLGIIPTGTLNHFAQDVGIPAQMKDAARVIVAGRTSLVDVGEVNGRIFINNVSLGVYPAALRERDRRQQRFGWGKWGAMAAASVAVLRQLPRHRVRLVIDECPLDRKTPFVFVGNNLYELGFGEMGQRGALNAGKLSVFVTHHRSRIGLLALAARALVGRLDEASEFDSFQARQLTLQCRRAELEAGLDGELVRLRSPLRFRIRPGALSVLTP